MSELRDAISGTSDMTRQLGRLASSSDRAANASKGLATAIGAASAVLATGIDTSKELSDVVDKLRSHTLIRAAGAFMTLANSVNSFAQSSPKLLSRQFDEAFQTVGKFQNSIANANQRMLAMGDGMSSVGQINERYNKTIQRINESTKMTVQQSEALYTSFVEGMRGVADSSGEATDEMEKVIRNTAKMGLTFEETGKSLDKFINLTQRYNQVRRAMADGNIEQIRGQLLALHSMGQLSQDAIREMSSIQTATAQSGMISEINQTVRPAAETAARTQKAQEDAMFAMQTEETKTLLAQQHMDVAKWAADTQKRWAAQLAYLSVITKTLNEFSAIVGVAFGGGTIARGALKGSGLGAKAAGVGSSLLRGAAVAGGALGRGGGILGAAAAMSGEVQPVFVVNMPGGGMIPGLPGMGRKSGKGISAAKMARGRGLITAAGAGSLDAGTRLSATRGGIMGAAGFLGGRAIAATGPAALVGAGFAAAGEATMRYGGWGLDAINAVGNVFGMDTLKSKAEIENDRKRDELSNSIEEDRQNRLQAVQSNYEVLVKYGNKEKAEEIKSRYSEQIKQGGTSAIGKAPARRVALELEEEANKLREIYGIQANYMEVTSKTERGIARVVAKLEEAKKETELGAQAANLMFESFSNAANMVSGMVGFAEMEANFLRQAASAAKDRAAVAEAQIPTLQKELTEQQNILSAAKERLKVELEKKDVDSSSVSDEDIEKLREGVDEAKKNVQGAVGALRQQQNEFHQSAIDSMKMESDAISRPFEQARKVQEQNINLSEAMLERNKALRLGIGVNYEDTVRVVNEMQKQVQVIHQETDARARNAEKLRAFAADESKDEKERELAAKYAKQEEMKVAELRTQATQTETRMLEASKSIREGYLDALESTVANMGAFAKIMPDRKSGFGNQYFASTFSLGAASGQMTPGGNVVQGTQNPILHTVHGLSGNIEALTDTMRQFSAVAGVDAKGIYAGIQGIEEQLYGPYGTLAAAGAGRKGVGVSAVGDMDGPRSIAGLGVTLADGETPALEGRPGHYGSPSHMVVTVRFEAPGGESLGETTVRDGGNGGSLPSNQRAVVSGS